MTVPFKERKNAEGWEGGREMGEEKVHCGLTLFIGPKLRHSSVHLTVSIDIEYSFVQSLFQESSLY